MEHELKTKIEISSKLEGSFFENIFLLFSYDFFLPSPIDLPPISSNFWQPEHILLGLYNQSEGGCSYEFLKYIIEWMEK